MKIRLLAASAALALLAGPSLAAEGAAAPGAHRYIAPAGQEGEELVGFIDMASLRRSGAIAEADGIIVPASGMTPYPDIISGRMRVDCTTRVASVTNTRITSLTGVDRGAADADLEPETLDEDDQATFALFCRAGADRGLQAFATARAAADHVRSATARPASGDEGEEDGADVSEEAAPSPSGK